MWLLHFLPDSFLQFVVHAVLIAGLLGTALFFFILGKFPIPLLGGYIRIGKIVSIILLVSGIYFEGGFSNEMQWRERVREMEAKVAKAEQESKEANAALDAKSNEKVKVIKEKAVVVKQYIDREVTKYDATCTIPAPVIKAHNAAAKNEAIK